MRKRNASSALRRSLSLKREEVILARSAKVASSSAIRSSRGLGLAVKIIKDNNIIEIHLINRNACYGLFINRLLISQG